MTDPHSPPTELASVLSDYVLGERLGSGQFGVVWAARHRRLDRDVAVKLLTESMRVDPQHSERFRREARILAHLDHRHVVQVFDYRESDGLHLLIMERLTGGTFADRLDNGLSPESILMSTLAAASALHHVHGQDVLHRDVKPQNLMFDGRGLLKVTDFGTARAQIDRSVQVPGPAEEPLTHHFDTTQLEVSFAGQFIGTPGYAAPEQAAMALGQPLQIIGPAADQYSLAAVLYQSLSGSYTHAIDGGPGALLARRVSIEARDLKLANPAVPSRISAVVMKALRRIPDERFGSVEEFAVTFAQACRSDLGPEWSGRSVVRLAEPGPILDAVSSSAPPLGTSAAQPRPNRRRAIALGASAVVAVAAAGWATKVALTSETADDASGSSTASTAGTASSDSTSSETPMSAAVSGAADSAAVELMEVWRFAAEDRIFVTPLMQPGVVVVGSFDGNLYGLDRDDGAVGWTADLNLSIRSSAVAAASLIIVGGDDGIVRALQAEDRKVLWEHHFDFGIVSTPLIVGDLTRDEGVVVVGANGLFGLTGKTGEVIWTVPTAGYVNSAPTLAGSIAVAGCNDGYVYAVDTAGGNQQWKFDTGGEVFASPTISDGVVYVGSRSGSFFALKLVDGKQVWTRNLGSAINSGGLVIDGGVIAGTTGADVVRMTLETGAVTDTWRAGGPVDATPVRWGEQVVIASHDARLTLLDTTLRTVVGSMTVSGPMLATPKVDGNSIYLGTYDGAVYRIDRQA